MEFNYLVEKRRMLDSLGRTGRRCDGVQCSICPLFKHNNDLTVFICADFEIENPLEATKIVRQWAEEHPKRTRKDVLLEKFPKAWLGYNGTPDCCAKVLGLCSEEECADRADRSESIDEYCLHCWDAEVENSLMVDDTERLAHTEKLDKKDSPFEPPCAVGDTIYEISVDNWVIEGLITEIIRENDGFRIIIKRPCLDFYFFVEKDASKIGKTLFLTREAAEAARTEREKEANGKGAVNG